MALLIEERVRPRPGFLACGDAAFVRRDAGGSLLALLDGVGHGLHAAEATDAALAALAAQPGYDLVALMGACDAAMSGTRGAALALMYVPAGQPHIEHLAVGNISSYLWLPERSRTLMSYNGIVGRLRRVPNPMRYDADDGQLLLMHSDGIPSRSIHATLASWDGHLAALADRLFARAIERDDASLLLAQLRSGNHALRGAEE